MPSLRLIAVPPCPFSLLPDKEFYDRPATGRLFQQSTGRDSDNPTACVVGLSQTRPCRDWSEILARFLKAKRIHLITVSFDETAYPFRIGLGIIPKTPSNRLVDEKL